MKTDVSKEPPDHEISSIGVEGTDTLLNFHRFALKITLRSKLCPYPSTPETTHIFQSIVYIFYKCV